MAIRIDSQRGRDASEAENGAAPKSKCRDVLVYGPDARIIAAHTEGLTGRQHLFPRRAARGRCRRARSITTTLVRAIQQGCPLRDSTTCATIRELGTPRPVQLSNKYRTTLAMRPYRLRCIISTLAMKRASPHLQRQLSISRQPSPQCARKIGIEAMGFGLKPLERATSGVF